MYKPESTVGNKTRKSLWNFKIQAYLIISARRPNLVIINKNKGTFRIVAFADSAKQRVKNKENEKKYKYLDFLREL